MAQLGLVAFGCILEGWRNLGIYNDDAAQCVEALWNCSCRAIKSTKLAREARAQEFRISIVDESHPLHIIADAARLFIGSKGLNRTRYVQLIGFGRRHSTFLALPRDHPSSVFGLADSIHLLQTLKGDYERVSFLRRLTSRILHETELQQGDLIILYQSTTGMKGQAGYFELATAVSFADTCGSVKRARDGTKSRFKHCCWLTDLDQGLGFGARSWRPHNEEARRSQLTSLGEILSDETQKVQYNRYTQRFALVNPPEPYASSKEGQDPEFHLLIGELETAALYIKAKCNKSGLFETFMPHVDLRQITHALDSDWISPDYLIAMINATTARETAFERSLYALAIADTIYQSLPNATIDLQIASQPLHRARWIPQLGSTSLNDSLNATPYTMKGMTQAKAFACIAMFESGHLNVDPEALTAVSAMSSGDSIFVAASLTCDPATRCPHWSIKRVVGNVGRAGIAMLVAPQNPRVRPRDINSWTQINHSPFNGNLDDCFQGTSVHLTFTGYEIPVASNSQSHGFQDSELFFLESPLSVYDRGKWVADIYVLTTLDNYDLRRIKCIPNCKVEQSRKKEMRDPPRRLRSIDSWEEILEKPTTAGIVRAHGNWLARLAMTSFSIGRGYNTVLLPKADVCWACFNEQHPYCPPSDMFIL